MDEPILMKSQFLMNFGSQVRKIRKSKDLTIEELAEVSGLNYSQIGRIERGVINTSLYSVFVLANSLNIEMKEFFEGLNQLDEQHSIE